MPDRPFGFISNEQLYPKIPPLPTAPPANMSQYTNHHNLASLSYPNSIQYPGTETYHNSNSPSPCVVEGSRPPSHSYPSNSPQQQYKPTYTAGHKPYPHYRPPCVVGGSRPPSHSSHGNSHCGVGPAMDKPFGFISNQNLYPKIPSLPTAPSTNMSVHNSHHSSDNWASLSYPNSVQYPGTTTTHNSNTPYVKGIHIPRLPYTSGGCSPPQPYKPTFSAGYKPSPQYRPPCTVGGSRTPSYPGNSSQQQYKPTYSAGHKPSSKYKPHCGVGGSRPTSHSYPGNSHSGVGSAMGYYWVASNTSRGVPPSAVRGGNDQDGTEIFVGRAFHQGDWVPAKVIPSKNIAYIPYGGEEHMKHEYEVLCEQKFQWSHCSGGNIPHNAVEGGRTSDGETLFIGRVHHNGSHTVGKIHPSHGCLYIPFGGQEVRYTNYEVLLLL